MIIVIIFSDYSNEYLSVCMYINVPKYEIEN